MMFLYPIVCSFTSCPAQEPITAVLAAEGCGESWTEPRPTKEEKNSPRGLGLGFPHGPEAPKRDVTVTT